MVTGNEHVDIRPTLSVAEQLTSVVPIENTTGLAGVALGTHPIDAMPLPSVADNDGV